MSVPVLQTYDITGIDCNVFSRIQIQTNPLGGNVIAWGFKDSFTAKGPYHFYVDFGRSSTNEWEVLNQTPVVDDCFFTDPCQRHWDTLVDYYYRVRLVLPNVVDAGGNCAVYVSAPQQANGIWGKSDWLKARYIMSQELKLQNKRTAKTSAGVLLKRRRYGQVSSTTTTWDTNEIQNTHADVDYGTGLIGGYFRAIDYRVTMDTPWARKFGRSDPTKGTTNEIVRTGRASAYPYVETSDVYHRLDSGERFIIREIETIAEIGNIPIIVQLKLSLAPTTSEIYKIPLSGGSSSAAPSSDSSASSSSDVEPARCGPTARIDESGEW